jgi:hypothetical protein
VNASVPLHPFRDQFNRLLDSKQNASRRSIIPNFSVYDFYIYIDRDEANKIKARNNRTGLVQSTHAKDANVPIQAAIDYLSKNSTQTTTTGPLLNLWTGGQYGSIYIGPGTYNIAKSIVAKSNITMQGAGMWNTELKLADSHADNNNATVIKSSTWDRKSTTTTDLQHGDTGIVIRDMTINGNKSNNSASVTTVTPSPGVESWGHGIALYGVGHLVENVLVKQCRGVGIIVQGVGTNLGDNTTVGFQKFEDHLNNVISSNNEQHGLLVRQTVKVDRYWSYENGEPGIDVQRCEYFSGGNSYFSKLWCFYDSGNHGGQETTTYDPLGSEIIITGTCFMYDSFIEGPWCMGDNLTLGRPGALQHPTGFALGAAAHLQASGLTFDAPRKYTIRLEPYTTLCDIRCHIMGIQLETGAYYDEAAGVYLNGAWANNLEIFCEYLKEPTNGAAMIFNGASFNNIKLSSWDNFTAIDWPGRACAHNNITAQIYAAPNETALAKPMNVDFTMNHFDFQISGDSTSARTHNSGTGTFSGNGSNTSFAITHNLLTSPTVVSITPGTVDAAGDHYVTVDDTNMVAHYKIAPPAGTNNVVLRWGASIE